jgi:phosphoribosylamine-glycine ligase
MTNARQVSRLRWIAKQNNILEEVVTFMRKKRILISGGGYADLPLIRSAKKLGYHVITTGNRPEELGHKESDEYHAADFSDLEAMLELAKQLNIDAICPCSNDFSAISSAYVAECLGLPGHDSYETTKLLHHKDSYREFALTNNIPTPKATGFTDIDSAFSALKSFQLPVMVKPVDLTGGKGISKLEQLSEAKQALQKAFAISKSNRIVVEEFMTGSRHGFSAFIREQKIVFYFSDNEHYYLNPYLVSAASTPTIVPQKIIDILIHQSEKIASLLSLKTGIFQPIL